MREIKFRAWNKEKNIMCYEDEDESASNVGDWYVSEIEIINLTFASEANKKKYDFMQYTGVKDKNGVDIFEGDILRIDNDVIRSFDLTFYGIVTFEDGAFCVEEKLTIERDSNLLKNFQAIVDYKGIMRAEVIGNIYENPELLEKGEKNV